MPRIRTVKPEFWADEKLSIMTTVDRFVFLGLISLADDAGRVLDNLKVIDAFIFPASSESASESLANLSRTGRIRRGITASGQPAIQITNWNVHQKIDHPNLKASLPEVIEVIGDKGPREWLANGSRETATLLAPDSRLYQYQRPTTSTNDLRPKRKKAAPDGAVPDTKPESWIVTVHEAHARFLGSRSFGRTGAMLAAHYETYGLPRLLAALASFRTHGPADKWYSKRITLSGFCDTIAIWDAMNDLDDPDEWAALKADPEKLAAHYMKRAVA